MVEVTLVTRDAARLEFSCPADENILSAAEAAGYDLPAAQIFAERLAG